MNQEALNWQCNNRTTKPSTVFVDGDCCIRSRAHIPVPGIDVHALSSLFGQGQGGQIAGLFNMFSGGAFKQRAVFAPSHALYFRFNHHANDDYDGA